jgi:hypothetical protein
MDKKEITNEGLARMVQKGFLTMGEEIKGIDKRLEKLEKGQEKIIEKLDSKADKFELRELKHRVEALEIKAGWGK